MIKKIILFCNMLLLISGISIQANAYQIYLPQPVPMNAVPVCVLSPLKICPLVIPPPTWSKLRYPFYVGFMIGYGATTWNGLVAKDQNAAMSLSTPTSVSEGGTAKGLFTGYEFSPYFALEASYFRYPPAKVYFDEMSLFTFYHDTTELDTTTDRMALAGKFMVFVPYTDFRVYSTVGVAYVHRHDIVSNCKRLRPIFGLGLNYNVIDHVMAEIGGEYIAGNAQSELDPAEHYIPFSYAGFFRLAYRC